MNSAAKRQTGAAPVCLSRFSPVLRPRVGASVTSANLAPLTAWLAGVGQRALHAASTVRARRSSELYDGYRSTMSTTSSVFSGPTAARATAENPSRLLVGSGPEGRAARRRGVVGRSATHARGRLDERTVRTHRQGHTHRGAGRVGIRPGTADSRSVRAGRPHQGTRNRRRPQPDVSPALTLQPAGRRA